MTTEASRAIMKVASHPRAYHLLREVAAGRDRIFYTDERPPGWSLLNRLGIMKRLDRTAYLTPFGREMADVMDVEIRGKVRR